jgi:hypothetical protein
LVDRLDLCSGETHRIAEVRSSRRLRSAVLQLTIDVAYSIAAIHELLIDGLRLITGGNRGGYRTGRSRCRGCAGCRDDRRVGRYRGRRRFVYCNLIVRGTPSHETSDPDECDDSHHGRMVAPPDVLSECFAGLRAAACDRDGRKRSAQRIGAQDIELALDRRVGFLPNRNGGSEHPLSCLGKGE